MGALEKYGRTVLEKAPDRFPVLFNMASIYASHREVEKSRKYLKKLKNAKKCDKTFWINNRFNVAKLCLNLFYLEKKEGKRVSAYELLREAHAADDSLISKEKLYEEGIKLVREENESRHAAVAYEILKKMEVDFPKNGRLYNEMAWHILSHRDKVIEDLETAKKYAVKAARLMENDRDPTLDMAYDNPCRSLLPDEGNSTRCWNTKKTPYKSLRLQEGGFTNTGWTTRTTVK